MTFEAPTEHMARNLARNLRNRGFIVQRSGRLVGVLTGTQTKRVLQARAVAQRYAAVAVQP